MISTSSKNESIRERLIVVGGSNGHSHVVDDFVARHPDWEVVRSASFLSGIAEICRSSTRAVVAMVESSHASLPQAVAGLREATGRDARVVLCCGPESEPSARAALGCGADEYIVWPVEISELEAAIGIAAPTPLAEVNPAAAIDQLAGLTDAIGLLEGRPNELLQKLAELVRSALGATGVTLAMPGAGATAGQAVTKAVLAVPIAGSAGDESLPMQASGSLGQLVLGEKLQGPYTPGDMEKLTQYARLIGGLLATASRQRHWRELAVTDSGSGLPNRRFLQEQLPRILERAVREHFAVTVLLFDVDDFKGFNDRHGHDAGDEILRVVGQLFRKACREQDIVTRYGGDEFAVVFWDAGGPREPGSKHPQQALFVVDRFTEALRTQRFSRLGQEGGRVTISGGLATFPWDASNMEDLISKADEALLSAKRAGKNRVVVVGG